MSAGTQQRRTVQRGCIACVFRLGFPRRAKKGAQTLETIRKVSTKITSRGRSIGEIFVSLVLQAQAAAAAAAAAVKATQTRGTLARFAYPCQTLFAMEAIIIKGFFAVLSWLFGFGADK